METREMIGERNSSVAAEFAEIGTSCRQFRTRFDVDIREFIILATLYDSCSASSQALSEVLELSASTVDYCLCKLAENGLAMELDRNTCEFCATTDGRKLVRTAYRQYESAAIDMAA